MNSVSVAGAFGEPSITPDCGIPLKRLPTSVDPGRAPGQFARPTVGKLDAGVFLLPPVSTTTRTTTTTMAATTPPAIASARGEAWRARAAPMPFERTGGG